MEYFAYSQKAFVYKYVVMFSDADQFKHMSFSNYIKLMFLASDALFVSCDNNEFLKCNRIKVRESRIQFKKQTVPGEKILIKVNTSQVEESAFILLYTFVIEGTGELVALARQKYVLINKKDGSELPLIDEMKDRLRPIQVEEKNLIYQY